MSDLPDPSAGGMDLGALLAQAQKMQESLMAAQATAASQEVEGSAGGGKVRVKVTGSGEFLSVHIDPSVVDPSDVEALEDLMLAALHDASGRVQQLSQSAMGGIGDALGLGGGLGGLFGQ